MKATKQDYRTFYDLVPELKERYFKSKNEELSEILLDPDYNPSENFWGAQEKLKEIFPILHECLDGHTRANMREKVLIMYHSGMFFKKDIEKFTPELQEWFLKKIGV